MIGKTWIDVYIFFNIFCYCLKLFFPMLNRKSVIVFWRSRLVFECFFSRYFFELFFLTDVIFYVGSSTGQGYPDCVLSRYRGTFSKRHLATGAANYRDQPKLCKIPFIYVGGNFIEIASVLSYRFNLIWVRYFFYLAFPNIQR